jgi:penicillin G amidase
MRPMPARPGTRTLLRALGRRLPRTRGEMRVSGLHGEVAIVRDRWGIPHIEAARDADAWFALGFCHGQDRAFQLELLARAGRGLLAELLGAAALPIDRLSRTLGFRRVARAQVAHLDADVLATLDAYVAGINAAQAASPRPHELVLLRARPSPWSVEDVLAFVGLQSLALAGSWDTELARQAILEADGPEALAAVEPAYGPWLPVVTPPGARAGEPLARLAADLARLSGLVGGSGGSNAWALAGSRTASGAPILANDPHLAPTVPPPWYLAHLRAADWELAGASFVGGPAFPTGFNAHAAWGITAACTDSADLFWEELSTDGRTARGPDGPEPVERIVEAIPVRGVSPVALEVLVTRRGPIVTGLLDGVSRALSMRATWLEPAPVRGFLDVNRARDFAAFRDAFRAWPGPSLNVVYADAHGHVGWQLIGTLPRRRIGSGIVPLPAWAADWEDEHLPFDDLPWTLDPPSGQVVSANNAPRADEQDAPFLGVDWLDGYRAARISEVLGDRTDWDVAGSMGLQTDTVSVGWRDLRELVLAAAPEDALTAMLREWDGVVAAGSAAASVYELLVAELACVTAHDDAPNGWRWAVGGGFGEAVPRTSFGARTVSQLVGRLRSGRGTELIPHALARARLMLSERRGADPAGWAWGEVRPLRLLHPLAVRRPLDRVLNLGPVPLGGDANTPAQAGVHPLRPLDNPAAIANHRAVIDLGDPERSRYVLAGGQSGNPLSPHYGDLFELWRRGEGVPIPWSRAAVEAATVDSLVLRPRMSTPTDVQPTS